MGQDLLPPISDIFRASIWGMTVITTLSISLLSVWLVPNIIFQLRKRFRDNPPGRIPSEKPKFIWALYCICILISVLGTAVASSAPKKEICVLKGDFRIAVAGFDINSGTVYKKLGKEIAEGIVLHLEQNLLDIHPNLIVSICGPAQVGTLNGTKEQRDLAAEELAERTQADLVIYGMIDTTKTTWQVSPQFYVSSQNFFEAQEITGPHDLGTPIELPDKHKILGRTELGSQMSARSKVLTNIAIGLAYASARNFPEAMKAYQLAEKVTEWQDDQGKQVLYILMGNAMLSKYQREKLQSNDPIDNEQLKIAKSYYEKSRALDNDYARAYLGLGSVAYLEALVPSDLSLKPEQIDNKFIDLCIQNYQHAQLAKNQPLLADISTKVHFGLGQCYLMKVYSGTEISMDNAFEEFQEVANDYGEGANPRVKELAGHAYARMGLIYDLSGATDNAVNKYKKALSLISENSEWRMVYVEALRKLLIGLGTPAP